MSNTYRIILLIFCSVFIVNTTYSQKRSIYFGYPYHISEFGDSTKLIIDKLPWHPNGRLDVDMSKTYFHQLKDFLENKREYKCDIHLYSWIGQDNERNYRYSCYQARAMEEFFLEWDSLFFRQYILNIIPHDSGFALFSDICQSKDLTISDCLAMKECVIIELIKPKFSFAQTKDTLLIQNKNETNTCYVLAKEYIKGIRTIINSTAELYSDCEHCTATILLSSEGAIQVSSLTANNVSFMQLDNIPIKIPILLKYSSLGPVCEPLIYGYDWDGHFLLDDDNHFSIHFCKSLLLQYPDFLEQLQHLNKQ